MLLSSWDTLLDQPLVSDSHSDASESTEIRLATDARTTSDYRNTDNDYPSTHSYTVLDLRGGSANSELSQSATSAVTDTS
jgi:hypothetical protein